jgi:hypothetical protein
MNPSAARVHAYAAALLSVLVPLTLSHGLLHSAAVCLSCKQKADAKDGAVLLKRN